MDEFSIFERALQIEDSDERAAFLKEACGDDFASRERIDALLQAHQNPNSFLNDPVAQSLRREQSDAIAETFDAGDPIESVGSVIGPYRLLQQIGEGGMGAVFMAGQFEPVRRKVALKIIKPGMDSRQVIARFEAERQALALMDHPNIAKVFDAGTTASGRPFFVMELVHGIPITDYCDGATLRPQERLELFVSVCRGVQHAHQKGIIHRDLKPSNILVAEYDHLAVPKIIDFGVAKATSQSLTENTLFTHFGQIVGTLEYMSPEQAKQNQLDVDTRSDVYSLGVVLYELLTGEKPFDKSLFADAAIDECLRVIREEDPPRPSLKISSSQTVAKVASNRRLEPRRLSAYVRGDVDWIIMKALEKDRARRYDSAADLAVDLECHLKSEPVRARPPRLTYRLRKFARRERTRLSAAMVVVAMFVLVSLWIGFQVRAERVEQAQRTSRLASSLEETSMILGRAIVSPIESDTEWAAAEASVQRVTAILDEGPIDQDARDRASELIESYEQANSNRTLALQIEECVIVSASNFDLESWTRMERDFRKLFRERGLDLDKIAPAEIGRRIRDDPSRVLLADALDLWIATRAQLSMFGGPPATKETMQPWADAIYVADPDPVRLGIRKLVYAARQPTRAEIDALVEGVEIDSLSPRTLSWLATLDSMALESERADEVFRTALRAHPGNFMLNFDYAFNLSYQDRHQEAIRYYMRCLALRDDVSGVWRSLGNLYRKTEEWEFAVDALEMAVKLEPTHAPLYSDLADTYLETEDFDGVIGVARIAIDRFGPTRKMHQIMGQACLAKMDYEAALAAFEQCLELTRDQGGDTEQLENWIEECRLKMQP